VAGGAFWSILGAGLSRGFALIAAILVARQLGAVGFGEYNLVQATAGMFQVFAGFGLGATTTKYLSGRYRFDPDAAGRLVGLSGLVSAAVGSLAMVVMALASPWLARGVLGSPQLGGALQLGSLMLLFGSIIGAQYGILAGLEKFRLIALVSGVGALFSIPPIVLGARLGGMRGAVAGLVVSGVVIVVLQGAAVRSATRAVGIAPRYASALREWRVLVSFSVPATLSNLLVTPVTWLSSAIVANQADGLRQLGLFSAANQWRNAIVLVAISATGVLFPVFSHLHDSGLDRALSGAFWTSTATMAGASLVAAVILSTAAPMLMHVYGAEFTGATSVVVLMVTTGAVSAPLSVVTSVIMGTGRMWLGCVLTFVWACVLLSLTWVLRDRGALGLSSAYLVATLVHLTGSLGCTPWILGSSAPAETPRSE
jgi:O-antigen/teichoic acid export membrane protein